MNKTSIWNKTSTWALLSTAVFAGSMVVFIIDKQKPFLSENGMIATGTIASVGLVGVIVSIGVMSAQYQGN